MFATLDLTWKPTSPTDITPPAGKAPAIVRGDTYAHRFRVTGGVTDGLDDYDWAAQLRTARLGGATAGDPTAEFTVDLEVDGDDLLVTIGLAWTVTIGLPASTVPLFWDCQIVSDGDVVTTVLAGKAKALDDVTRVAS